MHPIICNPKENEYEIDYINSCTLQEWCDNDIEELGLVKLQMKMCCIVYRSNQTARFNESRSKALTDFYVGLQTIIIRLDQNVIFYLDIGNGRKIVKVCQLL